MAATHATLGNGDYLDFEAKVAELDRQMNELRRLSSSGNPRSQS